MDFDKIVEQWSNKISKDAILQTLVIYSKFLFKEVKFGIEPYVIKKHEFEINNRQIETSYVSAWWKPARRRKVAYKEIY